MGCEKGEFSPTVIVQYAHDTVCVIDENIQSIFISVEKID